MTNPEILEKGGFYKEKPYYIYPDNKARILIGNSEPLQQLVLEEEPLKYLEGSHDRY